MNSEGSPRRHGGTENRKEETLDDKQLRIIRAALRYLDEELSPHGSQAFEDYLPGDAVSPAEVTELRESMERAVVGYVAREAIRQEADEDRVVVIVIPE